MIFCNRGALIMMLEFFLSQFTLGALETTLAIKLGNDFDFAPPKIAIWLFYFTGTKFLSCVILLVVP